MPHEEKHGEAAQVGPEAASAATGAGGRARWLILALLFVGASTASYLLRPPPPQSDEAAPKKQERPLPRALGLPETADQALGDRLLREGRLDLAAGVYESLGSENLEENPPPLVLRVALCKEGLGEWGEALRLYENVSRRGSQTEALTAALGQARLHLRRRQAHAARSLLWPIVLGTGRAEVESPFLTEAAHMLAQALAAEAVPPGEGDRLEHLAAPPDLPWECERALDWLAAPKPAEPPKEARIVGGADKAGREKTIVEVYLPRWPVRDIVKHLALRCDLPAAWSERAERLIADRTMTLHAANHSVLLLMQGVADAVDLCCVPQGEGVRFCAPDEIDASAQAGHKRARARLALTEALTRRSGHPLAPAAYLALGAVESNPRAAIGWLEELGRQHPASRLNLVGQYNLGVLRQQEGEHKEAVAAFYLVMDQAPGHPLGMLASLRLGQIYIEEGDFKRAIALLKRADGRTVDSRVRARLAATLAAAHTLNDDLAAVKATLGKHRDCFLEEPYASLGKLLQGYARLRQASVKKTPHDANDLVLALLALPEEPALGNLGKHLAGLAATDLGMADRAAAIFEGLANTVKGPLAVEFVMRLADARKDLGQREGARKLYLSIADARSPWAAWARFRLARLDLEDRNLDACIARCRTLLDEPTGLDRSALFALLGQAFEARGDFRRAAQCYAGQFPD